MPTSSDAATLAGDAVCIQSCVPDGLRVPALISLFADIAGVSKDPSDLIKNSVIINCCIPLGLQMAVLVSLFAQITGGSPVPSPCINLIPSNSVYDQGGTFQLNGLTPGTSYYVYFGANDAAMTNPFAGTINNPGNSHPILFVATSTFVVFDSVGLAGSSVTATLCAI
jgi:hypothetical protein